MGDIDPMIEFSNGSDATSEGDCEAVGRDDATREFTPGMCALFGGAAKVGESKPISRRSDVDVSVVDAF